jgi:hypothetical protein
MSRIPYLPQHNTTLHVRQHPPHNLGFAGKYLHKICVPFMDGYAITLQLSEAEFGKYSHLKFR